MLDILGFSWGSSEASYPNVYEQIQLQDEVYLEIPTDKVLSGEK